MHRHPHPRLSTDSVLPNEPVGRQHRKTLDYSLGLVAAAARGAIDWVDHASVSVASGHGDVDTLGATDPVALKVDALQWELREGPALAASMGAHLVHVRDLAADGRWPAYRSRVAELAIVAQTAVRLDGGDGFGGVLNLYSTCPHDLDDDSQTLVRIFAAQAATAVDFASRLEAKAAAVASRQLIGQAVGLVMERYGLDESAAFSHLVEESQRTQQKLRRIASQLVDQANHRMHGS